MINAIILSLLVLVWPDSPQGVRLIKEPIVKENVLIMGRDYEISILPDGRMLYIFKHVGAGDNIRIGD